MENNEDQAYQDENIPVNVLVGASLIGAKDGVTAALEEGAKQACACR